MYSGSATERLILALMDLVREKPISEVSVSDLLKKANVSKTMFYKLFRDKYDLAKRVWEREIEDLVNSDNFEEVDMFFISLYVMNKMVANRLYYRNLLKDLDEQNSFFQSWVEISMEHSFVPAESWKTDRTFETATKMFVYGANMCIREWLFKGCKEDAAELARQIEASVPANLVQFIKS